MKVTKITKITDEGGFKTDGSFDLFPRILLVFSNLNKKFLSKFKNFLYLINPFQLHLSFYNQFPCFIGLHEWEYSSKKCSLGHYKFSVTEKKCHRCGKKQILNRTSKKY